MTLGGLSGSLVELIATFAGLPLCLVVYWLLPKSAPMKG